jgi:GTP-binding protein
MNNSGQNILAIVGRPNVGKSTLFNRIVGRRIAIVHQEAGVTRDRISALAHWGDKTFEAVDTGGIAFMDDEKTADVLAAATQRQAEVAIEMASVIVLIVDVTEGVTPLDQEIARKLRVSDKPIFLAVNKTDNRARVAGAAEFSALGFEQTFSISAAHGGGVPELLDAIANVFVASTAIESAPAPRIAIVGRPNAGKSALINAIMKDDRTIVSEIPGTTRDSVDVPFMLRQGDVVKPYMLVDTAGLRHRSKIRSSVDQFGLMRAERSIRECDIAVLVLDAVAGVTTQDKRIAGQIAEARRGCVILVNKWDLAAEEEQKTKDEGQRTKDKGRRGGAAKKQSFREEYLEALRRTLFFVDWAPVLFVSAKTGLGLSELFDLIGRVEQELVRRVDTPQLNRLIGRTMDAQPPPTVNGKRFKIYYAFQKSSQPPTFTLFVNDTKCLTQHYERYLIARIRGAWGFDGCPVVFECRQHRQKNVTKTLQNRVNRGRR